MKILFTLLTLTFNIVIAFAQNGVQEFTVSGSFTVPAGVTKLTIEVIGAGGSGGGNGAGGGGGGGYAKGEYEVTPLSVLDVVVGEGGAGAAGGTTKVGSIISAKGGANGTTVPNPNLGGGGNGGTANGGTIVNFQGGKGGGGYYTYFGGGGAGAAGPNGVGGNGGNTIVWNGQNCLTPGGDGGLSGGYPGGNGGKGAGFTDNNCSVTDPAASGNKWGGGGGGGNGNGGGPGTGAGGYCKISWDYATQVGNMLQNDFVTVPSTSFSEFISVSNCNGKEEYKLLNTSGQLIWKGKNIASHNFSKLGNGTYILQVNKEGNIQTFKLVKE